MIALAVGEKSKPASDYALSVEYDATQGWLLKHMEGGVDSDVIRYPIDGHVAREDEVYVRMQYADKKFMVSRF